MKIKPHKQTKQEKKLIRHLGKVLKDKPEKQKSGIKIAIIGYGYVGRAMHRMFKEKVVAVYDPFVSEFDDYGHGQMIMRSKEGINCCDLAIVCVPTQSRKDGSCDTSIVYQTLKWLDTPLILIKSTVEPGTTDKLIKKTGKKIAFSPEYIGEGKYFTPPWMYPDPNDPTSHGFMVIGGETETCAGIIDIFVRTMGPHTKFTILTAKEAEVVKYMENIWGAMKVTFANVMYDCCKALGADYWRVREGWAADPRVERMHTAVFVNSRGFNGKCFPKDLLAFIRVVEKKGFEPKLLKEIWNTNARYRPQEYKRIK